MKSIKSLLLARNVAAAIVGIGLAASAMGQIGGGLTPNRLGTADDGMICRSGYTGAMSGSAFKCSKARTINVDLACLRGNFPNYVRRAKSLPNSDGKDLCVRNGIEVTSNGPLTGLTEGQQFVYAELDPAAVSAETAGLNTREANALGLDEKEVDTIAGQATIKVDPGSAVKDRVDVPVTHYTFAIKTGGISTALR